MSDSGLGNGALGNSYERVRLLNKCRSICLQNDAQSHLQTARPARTGNDSRSDAGTSQQPRQQDSYTACNMAATPVDANSKFLQSIVPEHYHFSTSSAGVRFPNAFSFSTAS